MENHVYPEHFTLLRHIKPNMKIETLKKLNSCCSLARTRVGLGIKFCSIQKTHIVVKEVFTHVSPQNETVWGALQEKI